MTQSASLLAEWSCCGPFCDTPECLDINFPLYKAYGEDEWVEQVETWSVQEIGAGKVEICCSTESVDHSCALCAIVRKRGWQQLCDRCQGWKDNLRHWDQSEDWLYVTGVPLREGALWDGKPDPSAEWESVSVGSEWDYIDVCSKSCGVAACFESVEVPEVVSDVNCNHLQPLIAVGHEAPPCTKPSPGAIWVCGSTEETSQFPMVEYAALSWWRAMRLWFGGWQGLFVEMRPELLRMMTFFPGIRVYFRERDEHVHADSAASGGAIPLWEVEAVVCAGATFRLVNRLRLQQADGRWYQVATLAYANVQETFDVNVLVNRYIRREGYSFIRVALTAREDRGLLLAELSEFPSEQSKVRAGYNLLATVLPDHLVGPFKDVRSEQLAQKNVMACEPVKIARQLCKYDRAVQNLTGRKAAFALK